MRIITAPFTIKYLPHNRIHLSFDEDCLEGYSRVACEDEGVVVNYRMKDSKLTCKRETVFELNPLWQMIPQYFAGAAIEDEMNKYIDLETGDVIDEESYYALEEIWLKEDTNVKWFFDVYANSIYAAVKLKLEQAISDFDKSVKEFAHSVGKKIESANGVLRITCGESKEIQMEVKHAQVLLNL